MSVHRRRFVAPPLVWSCLLACEGSRSPKVPWSGGLPRRLAFFSLIALVFFFLSLGPAPVNPPRSFRANRRNKEKAASAISLTPRVQLQKLPTAPCPRPNKFRCASKVNESMDNTLCANCNGRRTSRPNPPTSQLRSATEPRTKHGITAPRRDKCRLFLLGCVVAQRPGVEAPARQHAQPTKVSSFNCFCVHIDRTRAFHRFCPTTSGPTQA